MQCFKEHLVKKSTQDVGFRGKEAIGGGEEERMREGKIF